MLLLAESVGTLSVVVLVCTVACAVVEASEARGMAPRIWLGVKGGLGVGAFKRKRGADEGVCGNGLGGELVGNLVVAAK